MKELNRFIDLKKISAGSYGAVYKAKDIVSNKIVTLKKVARSEEDGIPVTVIREISILKQVAHKNTVYLFDVIFTPKNVFIVFESMNMNLKQLMIEKPEGLTQKKIKSYMFQMLDGLAFCHMKGAIHCDLKPQNVLVDLLGNIKLSDFGLSRFFNKTVYCYTPEFLTHCYRAPETLLGSEIYAFSLDIWSLGCILAELITRCVLFSEEGEINQIRCIFQLLGPANEEIWPGVTQLPKYEDDFATCLQTKQLPSVLLEHEAYTLFKSMMAYAPNVRISAEGALQNAYFSNVEHPQPAL